MCCVRGVCRGWEGDVGALVWVEIDGKLVRAAIKLIVISGWRG
jgi:hypothetical protein